MALDGTDHDACVVK